MRKWIKNEYNSRAGDMRPCRYCGKPIEWTRNRNNRMDVETFVGFIVNKHGEMEELTKIESYHLSCWRKAMMPRWELRLYEQRIFSSPSYVGE